MFQYEETRKEYNIMLELYKSESIFDEQGDANKAIELREKYTEMYQLYRKVCFLWEKEKGAPPPNMTPVTMLDDSSDMLESSISNSAFLSLV